VLSEFKFDNNKKNDYNIEIVYIQPNNNKAENNVITFLVIYEWLKHKTDPLTVRFLKSLKEWRENPNKKSEICH
jgi:hypothetical protein